MEGHSHIGSTPTDAVCPRDTYGYKAKPLAARSTDGFAVCARAARPSPASKDNAVDPTPSLLSFGEAITLVRQRLNASSEKAAAVVREALKSGELHIIRDEHVDPISGSQFAIVEGDFLEWLNRQVATQATPPQPTRKPDRERARQAAIELWGTAGPPDHLSNLSICRDVAQWLKKNGQAADISDGTILRAVGRR